jgi:hypothetical protein
VSGGEQGREWCLVFRKSTERRRTMSELHLPNEVIDYQDAHPCEYKMTTIPDWPCARIVFANLIVQLGTQMLISIAKCWASFAMYETTQVYMTRVVAPSGTRTTLPNKRFNGPSLERNV